MYHAPKFQSYQTPRLFIDASLSNTRGNHLRQLHISHRLSLWEFKLTQDYRLVTGEASVAIFETSMVI